MRRITKSLALALLVGLAVPALAQNNEEPAEKSAEQKAQEAAAQRVEWQLRMYRSLELSESQTEQLKKILIAEELDSGKRRDARRDKVREILTPDQKEKYNELVNRQGQGGRGRGGDNGRGRGGDNGQGGGRRGGGMFGRMGGMDPSQLKDRLKLTDEQETKVREVIENTARSVGEAMREMRNQGGFDFTKMRELINEKRAAANKEIEKLLTDAQKPEWQKVVKEFDERMAQFGGGRGGGERGPRGGGERGPRRAATPEEQIKRRVAAAMEALALGEEEAAVIQPLVQKVVEYQVKGGQSIRDLRESIGKLDDAEQIRAKMDEYRKAREEFQSKLALKCDGLRELVTVQQEAKLFALRIFELREQATTTAPKGE